MTTDSAPQIIEGHASVAYSDLRGDCLGLRALVPRGSEAFLTTSSATVVTAALLALDGHAAAVHLLPHAIQQPSGKFQSVEINAPGGAVARMSLSEPRITGPEETGWVVYTSGTTGAPKPVHHSLQSLTRTVRSTGVSDLVWGLLYDPLRMAGLQVLLQCLNSSSSLVVPSLELPVADKVRFMVREGVSALSATPTLWRLISQVPDTSDWNLRQVTLGGEIADQRILDVLAARFPQSRVSHIFASTETGAAFSVTDGLAGFPIDYLSEPPRGIQLLVKDDRLWVRNTQSSEADSFGYVDTGDVVEIVGRRVYFKGRASGVVNIGGTNIWPEEVETLIRTHPDVSDAVVYAVPNPLVGNLLIATVVPKVPEHAESLKKNLRHWIRERAAGTMVPAKVAVVTSLVSSETGKAMR